MFLLFYAAGYIQKLKFTAKFFVIVFKHFNTHRAIIIRLILAMSFLEYDTYLHTVN